MNFSFVQPGVWGHRRMLAAASVMLSASAIAQPMSVVVIDADLNRHEAELESVSFGELSFASEHDAFDDLLAVILLSGDRGRSGLTPPGFIELVDGTVYSGAISTVPSDDPEFFAWSHGLLGRLDVPLEELRAMTLPGHERIERSDLETDVVRYANGDSATGFVAELGFSVVLESPSGVVSTPTEYIAGVSLANEPAAVVGPRLHLKDGSVIDAPGLSIEGGGLSIDRVWAGEGARVRFGADSAVAYVADASRLVGLSSLRVVGSRSLGTGLVRRSPARINTNSALGAADVLLPGVMSAEWALPEGAARFAATARLPMDSRAWGDCELVAVSEGQELQRVRLHPGEPESAFVFDLPRGAISLTLRVDPGMHGPVQDRALLIEPLVRVDSIGK